MSPREQARTAAANALAELRALRARLAEPRALRPDDWSGLRLQQRLGEAPPSPASAEQLGPLNTAALVPRVLQRLNQLSPAYLKRLVTQLDALALLPSEAPAKAAPKKPRAASQPPGRPPSRTPNRAPNR